MLYYLKTTLRGRWISFLIIIIILSILGFGFVAAQSVSERIVLQTKTDLDQSWRYSFDLLVLPQQNGENKDRINDLIAPHSSIASYGGISIDDLELIRSIPGVKIAAPLSLIGYIPMEMIFATYTQANAGNIYEIKRITKTHDGLSEHVISESSYIHDYGYISDSPDEESAYSILSNKLTKERDGYKSTLPPSSSFRFNNELLLVAIDPIEENHLFTFNESLIVGNKLDSVPVKKFGSFNGNLIPIVALSNQQTIMDETVIISKIEVPEKVIESDIANDVQNYMNSLPKTEVVNLTIPTLSAEWKYKSVGNVNLLGGDKYKEEPNLGSITSNAELFRYSPITYNVLQNEDDTIPLLQPDKNESSNIFHSDMSANIPRYRFIMDDRASFPIGFNIIDLYDSEKVIPVLKTNWKQGNPVDIYTPPNSQILEDGAGNTLQEKFLLPLPFKDTYYSGAPDAITSIEAAEIFYEKDPISSIRIVVEGVSERTDASQRKVEKISKEIMDKTGHHVEIMLGSAAAKVHVDLGNEQAGEPGLLEEGWQKAGVSWSIQEQVEESNTLLFFYLLAVVFIFCYTVITHSLLSRSAEFAILRAVGWSRKKIIGALVVETVGLTLFSLIPIIIANIVLNTMAWSKLGYILLFVLPVIGIGYLTGSNKALKLSPRAGLEGEGNQWRFMALFPIRGLLSYIIHQLIRRPIRFSLLSIVLAMTSFMIILFIATQKSLSDFLLLSFLGETIDLNLKGFQTVFLVVGIILTVTIVFLLLFFNITERKGEFIILRSIGWSIQRIQIYMGIEVILIGLIGSIIGGVGAYCLLTYFSTIWLPIWLLLTVILAPSILMLIFTMLIVQKMKMKGIINGHYMM